MESPYSGQAILNDSFDEFKIIIPTKKQWFYILFSAVWLGFWAMGEAFAIRTFGSPLNQNVGLGGLFMLFWLCGWTIGGFFVIKSLFWNLIGKEVITFERGQVVIARKGLLLSRPKTYDLKEVKKIRVKEENTYNEIWSRKNNFIETNSGTIWFDYGMKTVRFGSGIDEAEANFILDKLKLKKLLVQTNF